MFAKIALQPLRVTEGGQQQQQIAKDIALEIMLQTYGHSEESNKRLFVKGRRAP